MSELLEGRKTWKLPMDQVEADPRPMDRGIMNSMASPVGMLYPVIVLECEGGWRVWDGRVRYRCAQELGWERIEAFIAEDEFDAERMKHMITLAANARAKNPMGEGEAIVALGDDELVAEVSGLVPAEIEARKRLAENLIDEVKEWVDEGLAASAAKRLALLPADQQRRVMGLALERMEEQNRTKRRKPREVPTFHTVDWALREVKSADQPPLPVMSERLIIAPPSGPDPVRVAAQIRALLDQFADYRDLLETAADILDGA